MSPGPKVPGRRKGAWDRMPTNFEIESSREKQPIQAIAAGLGLEAGVILPHGHHIAKVPIS